MANNTAHNALVRDALQELAAQGYTAWSNQTGVWFDYKLINGKLEKGRPHSYGKVGSGDIIIVLPVRIRYPEGPLLKMRMLGLHVEAEAKTGTGRQSDAQADHQKYCVERNGGIYILFRSAAELIENIKKIPTAMNF